MKIECPRCGFVTQFVEVDGIVRRDFKAHGNKADGVTCFNCNTPLKREALPEPSKVEKPSEPVKAEPEKKTFTKTRSNK